MSPEKIINELSIVQADGLACVICGFDYQRAQGFASVPAGRSVIGTQVFACVGHCAEAAGADPTTTNRRVGGGHR